MDSQFEALSQEHTAYVLSQAEENGLSVQGRRIRFLEVAPYLHTTAQALNLAHGYESAACDISPHSLRLGAAHHVSTHGGGKARLVASDFHNLPFEDNFFDITFIASAVHHTWQPERVISELARVTRGGGIIILYNEPVGSSGCFYQFRSSRLDGLSAWEQSLADAGLMRIISSPFPGSRDEELFGMIENDRIPLEIFTQCGLEIVAQTLTPHPSKVDDELIQLGADAKKISAALREKIAPLRVSLKHREQLMGVDLPDDAAIDLFSERYAASLATLSAVSGEERLQQQAKLFGGTLRVVYRKPGAETAHGSMLGKGYREVDGVDITDAIVDGIVLRLSETELPAIAAVHAEQLNRHFVAEDWLLLDQGGLFAECMVGATGRIRLMPRSGERQILLLRYYTVASDWGPYWVELTSGEHVLATHPVCKSESRLLKLALPLGCEQLELKLRWDHADEPSNPPQTPPAFHLAIRVAYLNTVVVHPHLAD
ncbi:MAG: class I SAM-dependent methyltransferase [Cyanobacteriota bacterium]